jgi:hypothetical protein
LKKGEGDPAADEGFFPEAKLVRELGFKINDEVATDAAWRRGQGRILEDTRDDALEGQHTGKDLREDFAKGVVVSIPRAEETQIRGKVFKRGRAIVNAHGLLTRHRCYASLVFSMGPKSYLLEGLPLKVNLVFLTPFISSAQKNRSYKTYESYTTYLLL